MGVCLGALRNAAEMKGTPWRPEEDAMVDECMRHKRMGWKAISKWLVENGFPRTATEIRNRVYRRKSAEMRRRQVLPEGSVAAKKAKKQQKCSKCGEPRAGHTCRAMLATSLILCRGHA